MAQDDELAARLLAAATSDDEPDRGPRLSEWSPEVEALYAVIDRLADVISTEQAIAGQKPKRIPRATRPRTAMQRAVKDRDDRKHRALVARVLPPDTT